MSATALSTVQELIENSLFEAIRLELVDKGYLPDITTYTNDAAGQIEWETDLKAIADAGTAIEIISERANDKLDVKKTPRIIISSGSFLPGAIGGDPTKKFVDMGDTFSAFTTPHQTTDFYINFHLISSKTMDERILNAILALSIPKRGYVPFWSDATSSFFVKYLNYHEGRDDVDGVIEKVYSYEIQDAWDREDIEVMTNIAKMTEITLNINIQKYMDGEWGHNTDPLIIT